MQFGFHLFRPTRGSVSSVVVFVLVMLPIIAVEIGRTDPSISQYLQHAGQLATWSADYIKRNNIAPSTSQMCNQWKGPTTALTSPHHEQLIVDEFKRVIKQQFTSQELSGNIGIIVNQAITNFQILVNNSFEDNFYLR